LLGQCVKKPRKGNRGDYVHTVLRFCGGCVCQDLQDLKQVMVLGGVEQDAMVESKAAKRLAKRVDRLIQQADTVMSELQAEKERVQV
jgi:hypothetical protein